MRYSTEKHYLCNALRASLLLLGVLLWLPTHGQEQQVLPFTLPHAVQVNFDGQVYALKTPNELVALDTQAQVLREFTVAVPFQDIQFRNRWKVFLFSQEQQTFYFLNRFLTVIDRFTLSPDLGWITLAAPSADQTLWLYDAAALELIRYDPQQQEVISRTALIRWISDAGSPTLLKEYQNQLFLYFPDYGVWIFDLVGNFREKIALPAAGNIQFIGESLCFWDTDAQSWGSWHLYRSELHYQKLENQPKNIRKALRVGDAWWLFTSKELIIRKNSP